MTISTSSILPEIGNPIIIKIATVNYEMQQISDNLTLNHWRHLTD